MRGHMLRFRQRPFLFSFFLPSSSTIITSVFRSARILVRALYAYRWIRAGVRVKQIYLPCYNRAIRDDISRNMSLLFHVVLFHLTSVDTYARSRKPVCVDDYRKTTLACYHAETRVRRNSPDDASERRGNVAAILVALIILRSRGQIRFPGELSNSRRGAFVTAHLNLPKFFCAVAQ